MTDWDLIAEYIHDAMQVVEQTHEAGEELKKSVSPENLDIFHAQMMELHEHLSKIKEALEHQDTYALDEISDRLSMLLQGHQADYRKTSRL
jgi:hypothetical protein